MNFKMIDVGEKPVTFRRAIAHGKIILAPDAFEALREKKNPKGDVLALAEIAGIMAAKKTSDLIPLCHPLPLEKVSIRFELDSAAFSIIVYCEASAHAKTGVEMEALCGVNGALLTIYDLSKAVNPVITISEIQLDFKEGGKTGAAFSARTLAGEKSDNNHHSGNFNLAALRAAVITISDRTHAGKSEDTSGPLIASMLREWGAEVTFTTVVPDEKEAIISALNEAAREKDCRLVITTGGTGLSPRDVTPEALELACDRMISGFGELLRNAGSKKTDMAWLSRQSAGLMGNSLIIALPGSQKAVREGMESLKAILPHALHTIQGGDHDRV